MSLAGRSLVFLVIMCSVALAFAGCGSTTRMFTKPISESTYVTYPEWGPNRTVAVMPFTNVAKDKDAGLKVRELFITELYISGAFKDIVDEGEMLEVMKKLKLRGADPLGKESVKTLGDNLGAQALIFGNVEEYNERSSKGAQFVISLRMVDVETGTILWLGNASMEGGGTVREALGLSEGPTIIDVARDVIYDLVGDLAHVIRHKKVKVLRKQEEAARKNENQKSAASKEPPVGAPANQQAGASPAPSVKGSSAGMVSTPALGGN